jgi:hypothetical protein
VKQTGNARLTAISGGLAHPSALVEDAVGGSDTRLSHGATFGIDQTKLPLRGLARQDQRQLDVPVYGRGDGKAMR